MTQISKDWQELFERNGIDPNMVIDATSDVTVTYMWKSPLGHYEARIPHSHDDQQVGQRVTSTFAIELVGTHPESTETTVEGEGMVWSRVTFIEEGDWVFDTPEETARM